MLEAAEAGKKQKIVVAEAGGSGSKVAHISPVHNVYIEEGEIVEPRFANLDAELILPEEEEFVDEDALSDD